MRSYLLAEFCMRLAAGLASMMLATSARSVGVPFFRTIMLVVLGLAVLGILAGPGLLSMPSVALIVAACSAFVGFAGWTLRHRAIGYAAVVGVLVSSSIALIWPHDAPNSAPWLRLVQMGESMASALLLGSVVAAMLLGHSYLIAPTMSIEPLRRLIAWLALALVVRAAFALLGFVMAWNIAAPEGSVASGSSLWWSLLASRWVIGFAAPGIMAWMTWETTRIRATQSATGILYAAVILVFFGELVGQLLAAPNGVAL